MGYPSSALYLLTLTRERPIVDCSNMFDRRAGRRVCSPSSSGRALSLPDGFLEENYRRFLAKILPNVFQADMVRSDKPGTVHAMRVSSGFGGSMTGGFASNLGDVVEQLNIAAARLPYCDRNAKLRGLIKRIEWSIEDGDDLTGPVRALVGATRAALDDDPLVQVYRIAQALERDVLGEARPTTDAPQA